MDEKNPRTYLRQLRREVLSASRWALEKYGHRIVECSFCHRIGTTDDWHIHSICLDCQSKHKIYKLNPVTEDTLSKMEKLNIIKCGEKLKKNKS